MAQLHAGLREAAADPGVRVVVLGHTGNTFCAGADLSEATSGPVDPEGPVAGRARALAGLLRALVELPKPVVAAVDGHVRAGGMGLVAACDLAVAGPAATFALTEARLGVAPSIISLTVLPRLTSRAASRYFLTGEKFDAPRRPRRWAWSRWPRPTCRRPSPSWSRRCAWAPRRVWPESKKLVTAPVLAAFDADADALASASARLFASEEAREGMTAFLQRRPPSWAE